MIRGCLLDTGPLVASLDARDQFHKKAVNHFKQLSPPLYTCESVITETCFLISGNNSALAWLKKWLLGGQIVVDFQLEAYKKRVFNLIEKYKDLPMSLTDASLVAMYEENPNSRVFTLDHHFTIYRTSKKRVIKTIGLD